jgi:hypothetical protein
VRQERGREQEAIILLHNPAQWLGSRSVAKQNLKLLKQATEGWSCVDRKKGAYYGMAYPGVRFPVVPTAEQKKERTKPSVGDRATGSEPVVVCENESNLGELSKQKDPWLLVVPIIINP